MIDDHEAKVRESAKRYWESRLAVYAEPGVRVDSVELLCNEVEAWASTMFPKRSIDKLMLKLYEEIGELARDPSARHEYADIIIVLLDMANLMGLHDVGRAVIEKLAINWNRDWSANAIGVTSHVKEK